MDKTTKLAKLLAKAGIAINGSQPWDIQIHHPKTLSRMVNEPSLGAGESYMDGWWECQRLDDFFFKILRYLEIRKIYQPRTLLKFYLMNFLTNQQSKHKSLRVAHQHYNIDNELYELMLGKSMAYTCGYWSNAHSLEDAQYAKYDLICRKLKLQPHEKVLELGCGFGGFAKYAAEKYGVAMVSVNISTEQLKYARSICQGLPIQLFESDYRDVRKYNPDKIKFDKVVSIGLCEHIGPKNYDNFLNIAKSQLKPDGLFLLHTISKNISDYFTDPWIQKYIFPQGMLPTLRSLSRAAEGKFVIEDVHNIGADYDKTLMAWHDNFDQAWAQLADKYDERFRRMWRYYLLSCAGGFRARSMQLNQFVLSPEGELNGYRSYR